MATNARNNFLPAQLFLKFEKDWKKKEMLEMKQKNSIIYPKSASELMIMGY